MYGWKLCSVADFRAFLNFNERSDLHVVADFTAVKICEIVNADVFSQFYIGRDPLKLLRWLAHDSWPFVLIFISSLRPFARELFFAPFTRCGASTLEVESGAVQWQAHG